MFLKGKLNHFLNGWFVLLTNYSKHDNSQKVKIKNDTTS